MFLPLMMALQVAMVTPATGPVDPDPAPRIPELPVIGPVLPTAVLSEDTVPERPRSIEYSDAYATRQKIHRIGSFAMLPLAATEYILGNQLLQRAPEDRGDGLRSAHGAVAGGLGAVFGVNTVTGVWNLWEGRSDPDGRTRRTVHAALLLASDVGFLWAASLGEGGQESHDGAVRHRNVALGSIGVATLGSAVMWLWND
ncbi:MAG: hypothetical protein LBG44_04730 [Gemmatimonadota bacterium]|jgi:hypothetical protein|nr:hypothetical protein [Gemmatimonadota bacterium]